MPETLNESPRPSQADIESARGRPFEAEEGRSLAAGQAFVSALRVDLWALLRRLGRTFWSVSQRETQASPISRKRSALRRAIGGLTKTIAFVAVLGSVTMVGAMFWVLHDLPAERSVAGNGEASFLVEAADGEMLGRVGPLKMVDAARSDFSDNLVNAVISIEDRHFYSRPGFDPQGILTTVGRNIAGILEGGSTITEQLLKMRILGHERTLPHKFG